MDDGCGLIVHCLSSIVCRRRAIVPPLPFRYNERGHLCREERPSLYMDRWLPSGYGFRRWAFTLAAGVAIIGLGVAMALTNFYKRYVVDSTGTTFLYYATFQFIPHPWREIGVGLLGVGIAVAGALGINRAVRRAA